VAFSQPVGFKKGIPAEQKKRRLNLHITRHGVELLDLPDTPRLLHLAFPEIHAMKRLLVLIIIAAFAAPLAGCCDAWPRLWSYRGDPCNVYPSYESMPAVSGGLIAPPAQGTEVLPGPASMESST